MATNYIWDFATDSYLMEKDDNGTTTAVYTNEPVQYGRLNSLRRGSATHYYHFDGQGSTQQLTDQTGNVTDEYTYSAFGEKVASSGTTATPFGFGGKYGYFSDGPNEIDVRVRRYVPGIGRWMTQDPLRYQIAITQYHYARARPVSAIDPSGLLDTATACCVSPTILLGGGTLHAAACNALNTDDKFRSIRERKTFANYGTVVCICGVKFPCIIWNHLSMVFPYTPGSCPEVEACILQHERNHIRNDDLKCTDATIHVPVFKTMPDQITAECRERRLTLKCLKPLLQDPKDDAPAQQCEELAARLTKLAERYIKDMC